MAQPFHTEARAALAQRIEARFEELGPIMDKNHREIWPSLTNAERIEVYRARQEMSWLHIRKRWRVSILHSGGISGLGAAASRRQSWRSEDSWRWARRQTSFDLAVIRDYRRMAAELSARIADGEAA